MARQKLHWGRAHSCAKCTVHGRLRRQAAQSSLESVLRSSCGCRQAKDGCHHRGRPKAPDYPKRHHQGQSAMANRLTAKTVALPTAGEGSSESQQKEWVRGRLQPLTQTSRLNFW